MTADDCASRERLTELHALVGDLLEEAVELAPGRRGGCEPGAPAT